MSEPSPFDRPLSREMLSVLVCAGCASALTPTKASLLTASERLLACANHLVAAAAVLGENQCIEENPGSMSAGGACIANAGRALASAGRSLHADGEWSAATAPLADVAESFFAASASLDELLGVDELQSAAAAVQDASEVTGCISLAAAAGPPLDDCGAALQRASVALRALGDGMSDGPLPAHGEAGGRLLQVWRAERVVTAGWGMLAAGARPPAGGGVI